MARELIQQYLRETSRAPFVWGQCDCVLWVADLIVKAGHADPAAEHRGTYSTKFEARSLVMRLGGMRGLAQRHTQSLDAGERADGVCLAICGPQTLFGVLSGGVLHLKMDRALYCPGEYKILEGWSLWPKR